MSDNAPNSNHQTGPTSDAGKATSSRNATKHGCCSNETILATESIEDFKALEQAWFRAYHPKEQAEMRLIHQLIEADWFLERANIAVINIEAQLYATEPNPLNWTEAQQKTLARFLRYQTARTNLVIKHRRAIEDYRKDRAAEITRTQTAKDKAERLDISKSKLEFAKQKNNPIPDFGEHLEQMRQRAIKLGFTPPIG